MKSDKKGSGAVIHKSYRVSDDDVLGFDGYKYNSRITISKAKSYNEVQLFTELFAGRPTFQTPLTGSGMMPSRRSWSQATAG